MYLRKKLFRDCNNELVECWIEIPEGVQKLVDVGGGLHIPKPDSTLLNPPSERIPSGDWVKTTNEPN